MATHYIAQLLLPLALMVVVHCQTSYPQFEFGDAALTNNSYINREGIGEGVDDSLRCVTDYSDCCAGAGSDVGTGLIEMAMKSTREQMEPLICMSQEDKEWSISIVSLEEYQECGDVTYLIVME